MDIDPGMTRAIGAIYADLGAGTRALGTCFLMSQSRPAVQGGKRHALVTAAHVLPIGVATHVRLAGQALEVEDLVWRRHLTEDVAVADVDQAPLGMVGAQDIPTDLAAGAGPDPWAPRLGLHVAFFGLLPNLEMTGISGLPVLRGGNIAALDQSGIKYRATGATTLSGTAHLIDCRATRGMSGGPCFVGRLDKWSAGDGSVTVGTSVRLLGLVSGHFDDPLTGIDGAEAAQGFSQHIGIGLVTPSRFILEALAGPEWTYEA